MATALGFGICVCLGGVLVGCVFFLLVGATNSFKQLYTGFAKHYFLQNFLYRIAFYY